MKRTVCTSEIDKLVKSILTHALPCPQIVMANMASKDQLEFPVDRWLDEDEEDGSCVRELPAAWPEEEPLPGRPAAM